MFRVSIFEGFEPESEDEDDEEEQDDEEAEAQEGGLSKEDRERIEQLAIQDFPDDEPFEPEPEREPEETGTGIQTSQLRHFVIQVSSPGRASNDFKLKLSFLLHRNMSLGHCWWIRKNALIEQEHTWRGTKSVEQDMVSGCLKAEPKRSCSSTFEHMS